MNSSSRAASVLALATMLGASSALAGNGFEFIDEGTANSGVISNGMIPIGDGGSAYDHGNVHLPCNLTTFEGDMNFQNMTTQTLWPELAVTVTDRATNQTIANLYGNPVSYVPQIPATAAGQQGEIGFDLLAGYSTQAFSGSAHPSGVTITVSVLGFTQNVYNTTEGSYDFMYELADDGQTLPTSYSVNIRATCI